MWAIPGAESRMGRPVEQIADWLDKLGLGLPRIEPRGAHRARHRVGLVPVRHCAKTRGEAGMSA